MVGAPHTLPIRAKAIDRTRPQRLFAEKSEGVSWKCFPATDDVFFSTATSSRLCNDSEEVMKARSNSKRPADRHLVRSTKSPNGFENSAQADPRNQRTRESENRTAPQAQAERFTPLDARLPGSGRLFQTLLDRLPTSGVAIVDPKGLLLYANRRFAELFRVGTPNFLGETFPNGAKLRDYISPPYWKSLELALKQASAQSVDGAMEALEEDSAKPSTIRVSFFSMRADADARGIIGIVATETAELVEASLALKASEASRQSLSIKLLQLQDEERRRMARELHDSAGQELAFAVMSLEGLSNNLNQPNVDLRKGLAESLKWIRKVENEIRTFSYLLHPPLLDEMGLASALRWYVDGFIKRTGIQVELELPEHLPRFPAQHEIALFRVIQESLTNVFRHSGSRRARVALSVNSGAVELLVEDKGRNFKRGKNQASQTPGVGIQSMKGRLEPLNGHLEVLHGPQGTRVRAKVPAHTAESGSAGEPAVERRLGGRRAEHGGLGEAPARKP